MYQRIYASKYRQEVISLVWDFRDQLSPGDTLNYAGSNVIVSSGTDPNPTEMLRAPPSLSGNVVTQRIRRGIPGTIYTITVLGGTVGGDYFENVCYLAILPTLGDLNVKLWETTQLYPLDFQESLRGVTILLSGRLNGYRIPPEYIQGFTVLQDGSLRKQIKTYNMLPEAIQGFTILREGNLHTTTSTVTYRIGHENIQGVTILLSGNLVRQIIYYTIPNEDIQGFTILTSGTLT